MNNTVRGIKTGKVLGDVKTKTFGNKVLHEWFMSLYAGKNQDGTYKRAGITVKAWGVEPPARGDEIVVHGELQAEVFTDASGKEVAKIVINCAEFDYVGQEQEQEQENLNQQGDQLPF